VTESQADKLITVLASMHTSLGVIAFCLGAIALIIALKSTRK
jgi:hypothetical protein